MTHRIVNTNGKATSEQISAFERHLREHGKGSRRIGSDAHREVMLENILMSHTKGRFSFAARAAVLENLHCPADPEKSLNAISALGMMAIASQEARGPFLKTARKWHGDITMQAVHPAEWLAGERFIRTISRLMTALPPADSCEGVQLFQRAAAGQ